MAGGATTTILLVDDSITDRTRSTGLIGKANSAWDVIPVASAQEALQQLSSRRIDIVVSDLVMPGIDGRQLLRIMSDDYPLVPVVLISSHGDDQMAAECIALGAVNYVAKSRLAEDLIDILEQIVHASAETEITRRVLEHVVQNRCEFEINSDLDQIRALVNFIRERLHAMHIFCAQKVQDTTIAVRESLLNAHFHGNFQVNREPLELSRSDYINVAAERRNSKSYADRRIHLSMIREPGLITFCVRDDGPGFDQSVLEGLTEPPDERFPNGNGFRYMRKLMDSVSFNDSGNEVTLTATIDSAE